MPNAIHYERELSFFLKAIEYNKLNFHRATIYNPPAYTDADLGLRNKIGLAYNFSHLKKIIEQKIKSNSILYFMDEFFCHYILLFLPDTSPEEVLVIGPYLTANESGKIAEFLDEKEISPAWLNILNEYYSKIPKFPNEDTLNSLLYTFADCIWGEENYTIDHFVNNISDSTLALASPPDAKVRLDNLANMDLIEAFYEQENALINAVSHGQLARAKTLLSNLPLLNFKNQMEPLQNLRVFSIVLNTLLRKAIEHGGVPPIYIDQLSNTMIQRISTLTRSDNILDLWNEMLQKYCTLVNNHSTREYSLPIQKVIIQINMDLSADLSLKTLAEYLNVNASYLSNLFHKETGTTLTNYVNQKRMDYAAWLLSSTQLPISTIAQHCGILDDNYFTKLFKKQFELTPTSYRDVAGKHDLSK